MLTTFKELKQLRLRIKQDQYYWLNGALRAVDAMEKELRVFRKQCENVVFRDDPHAMKLDWQLVREMQEALGTSDPVEGAKEVLTLKARIAELEGE